MKEYYTLTISNNHNYKIDLGYNYFENNVTLYLYDLGEETIKKLESIQFIAIDKKDILSRRMTRKITASFSIVLDNIKKNYSLRKYIGNAHPMATVIVEKHYYPEDHEYF